MAGTIYNNQTNEEILITDSAKVKKWTTYFHQDLTKSRIFENFNDQLPIDVLTARIVSSGWYEFSKLMPWILCCAATKVSTNLARHFIIQSAFEELGMRDQKQIHADMFWRAAHSIGATPNKSLLEKDSALEDSLNYLKETIIS